MEGRNRNKLEAQNELLAAVGEAQALFISGQEPDQVYAQMLQILVRATNSEYGFFDEVIRNPDGKTVERILAISDISWNDESRRIYQEIKAGRFELLSLDNLAGAPVLENRTAIANDAPNDPRAKGLPAGHPAIRRYMGIPLHFGDELIGVVGVANRPDDYTEEIAAFIRPLTQAAAAMIQAGRAARREREMLAALKASEEQYRLIAETSQEGIWAVDADFRTTYVNARMAAMLGCAPPEMLGRPVADFIHAEDMDDYRRKVAQRLQASGDLSYERRLRRRDGAVVWTLVSASPMYDAGGVFAGSFAMFTDITVRKRMEAQLRQNETRFRQMFINAPMPYQSLDEQGNFLDVNQAFLDALGYRREELIGRNFGEILHPEWRDHFKENFPRFKAVGEILGVEFEMVKKDGSTILVFFNGKIQRDDENRFQRTHCIFQDITESRRIQATLQDRERYLSAILETIQEGFWVLDEAGRLLDVNAAYCRMIGYGREELLKLGINDLDALETPADTTARIARIRARGFERFESRHRRRDGGLLELEISVVWLDQARRLICMGRDIGERRQAEAERENLQAQLSQAQKMESVGRLAGGVAHDFNNMLGVILGYAELALAKVAEDDPLHADLTEIVTAARRSADITRQLLAFARRQTVSPRVIDLNDAVEGTLKLLRRLIGEDIDLAWLPTKNIWPVNIDPAQVDQILANLCVNARDAITGVGKITIQTRSVTFDDQHCALHPNFYPGQFVMLAVSDDGCGMDAETCSHLFEPFFTTKEVGQGTGLGLATVYGIVKQNDGFIDASSQQGAGSTFRIYLPRHAGRVAEACEATEDIPLGQGETILIVEDEAAILKLCQTMLENLGYTALAAAGTAEALALAEAHAGKIHLLITDVVMPRMNGRDLAARLQALCPGLRVLFMSGYTAEVIARQGILDAGMQFIQKPFSRDELALKVREVLG